MNLSDNGLSFDIISSMQDAKTEIEAIRILEDLLSISLSNTSISTEVDECFTFLANLCHPRC